MPFMRTAKQGTVNMAKSADKSANKQRKTVTASATTPEIAAAPVVDAKPSTHEFDLHALATSILEDTIVPTLDQIKSLAQGVIRSFKSSKGKKAKKAKNGPTSNAKAEKKNKGKDKVNAEPKGKGKALKSRKEPKLPKSGLPEAAHISPERQL